MSTPEYGNGKFIFELFPQEYIDLNKELSQDHLKLHQIFAEAGCSMDDIDLKIALTAAYCEIQLNDIYTLDDRIKLCKILTQRLKLKREIPKSQIILN